MSATDGLSGSALLSRMATMEQSFFSLRRTIGSSISSLPGTSSGSNDTAIGAFIGLASGRAHPSADKERGGLASRTDSRRTRGGQTPEPSSPRETLKRSLHAQWRYGENAAATRRPSPFGSRGDSSASAGARPLALGFGLFGGDNDPLQAREASCSPSRASVSTANEAVRRPYVAPGAIQGSGWDSSRRGNITGATNQSSSSNGLPLSSFRSVHSSSPVDSRLGSKLAAERHFATPERRGLSSSLEARPGGSVSFERPPLSPSHTAGRPPLPGPASPPSVPRGIVPRGREPMAEVRPITSHHARSLSHGTGSGSKLPPSQATPSFATLAPTETPGALVAQDENIAAARSACSEEPRYTIKLMSSHHGQPCGWYLGAHRSCPRDCRDDNSTYASVHRAGVPDAAGEWVIEQGSAVGRYMIRLASNHHGQLADWYLDARRLVGKDRRSGGSTYCIVHSAQTDSVGEWAFEHCSIADRYKIKFVSSHHGQPAGWYLDAFRSEPADQRSSDSTYAAVHGEGHRDWTVEWELELVSDGSPQCVRPNLHVEDVQRSRSDGASSPFSSAAASTPVSLPAQSPAVPEVSRPRSNSPLRDSVPAAVPQQFRWPTGNSDSSSDSPEPPPSKSPVACGRPPPAPVSNWPSASRGAISPPGPRIPSGSGPGRSQSSSPLSKVSAPATPLDARSRSSSPLRRAAASPCNGAESPSATPPQLPRGWGSTTALIDRSDPGSGRPEPTFGAGESVESSPSKGPHFGNRQVKSPSHGSMCTEELRPSSNGKDVLANAGRAPSPVGDSLGSILSIVEPLLDQLLRGGGPEATPEGGTQPQDMRLSETDKLSVASALLKLTKTARELAGQVETLKDDNRALRMECDELKAAQRSRTAEQCSPGNSAPVASLVHQDDPGQQAARLPGLQASHERLCVGQKQPGARSGRSREPILPAKMNSAPVSAPAAWPCPAGWSMPSSSSSRVGSNADAQMPQTVVHPQVPTRTLERRAPSREQLRSFSSATTALCTASVCEPPLSEATPAREEGTHFEHSDDASSITRSRLAALNDDLGKALLKLQRAPDENANASQPNLVI